jgi:hypothetical protein
MPIQQWDDRWGSSAVAAQWGFPCYCAKHRFTAKQAQKAAAQMHGETRPVVHGKPRRAVLSQFSPIPRFSTVPRRMELSAEPHRKNHWAKNNQTKYL